MAKTLIANVVMDVLGSLDRVGYGPIFGNADAVPTDVAARISNPAAWALTATSEAAMLALSATVGDVCIRTDLDPDGVFILTSTPAATLANWTHLNPLPELSLGGVDIATQAELEAALAAKQDVIPPGTLVQVAGDTMTGPLILSGDPAADLEAATKAYVDATAGGVDGGTDSVLEMASWRVEAETYNAGTDALTDQVGTNHARLGSAVGADSADPKLLVYDAADGSYVRLPGTASNYLSVPDSAALSIVGDQCGLWGGFPDSWVPGTAMALVAKSTNAGSQRSWYMDVNSSGFLRLYLSTDGNAPTNVQSTLAVPAGTKEILWSWRQSDGRVQFWTASTVGGSLTQLGTDTFLFAGLAIFDSTAVLTIGAHNAGALLPFQGNFYRYRHWSGLVRDDAHLVLDIDPTAAAEPFASFGERSTNGATVTVNRSASGRKTTVVNRTGLLFGVDDYAEVADNAALDFGTNDSFTLAVALRVHGLPAANQVLVAKKNDLTTAAGYALWIDTSGRVNGIVADGSASTTVQSSPLTSGRGYLVQLVRDAAGNTLRLDVNETAGTPVADATASLANALPLRIGSLSGTPGSFGDFLAFGSYLFPDALSVAESAALFTELAVGAATAYVPTEGGYTASTDPVATTIVFGEAYNRFKQLADGSAYVSDGTYAPKRAWFISTKVGGADTAGAERTAFGINAGLDATLYKGTFFGAYAGQHSTGRSQTLIGAHAGEWSESNETVAVGVNALGLCTTGNFNTGLGGHSFEGLISGHWNSGFGDEVGSRLIDGDHNTLGGFYSLVIYDPSYDPGVGAAGVGSKHNHRCVVFGVKAGSMGPKSGTVAVPTADWSDMVILGWEARAHGDYTGCLGSSTRALASGAWAIGTDHLGGAATTSTQDEIKLGTTLHTVHAGKDIRTAQGGLAGAGKWRLGQRVTADITGVDGDVDFFDGYLEVEVDGTVLKLALVA